MQTIAITNQKGGVGKTTTAVNLAVALERLDRKVLLLDLDSQGNATTSTGLDKNTLAHSMADVLLDGVSLTEALVTAPIGVDVVGANRDLAGMDVSLAQVDDAPMLLRSALAKLSGYDFVIMDCAPSLSLSTVNALLATQGVIIPMQCEYYALEGVADLMATIDKLKHLNPELHVRGVLRTLYDPRSTLVRDVTSELAEYFGQTLYQTFIPRNVRLAEAPSFGQSVFEYAKSSSGAKAYAQLAQEVLAQG